MNNEDKFDKHISAELIEEFAFSFPDGMEGYHCFRIEYGGHGRECVCEGRIWLPPDANPDEVEALLDPKGFTLWAPI